MFVDLRRDPNIVKVMSEEDGRRAFELAAAYIKSGAMHTTTDADHPRCCDQGTTRVFFKDYAAEPEYVPDLVMVFEKYMTEEISYVTQNINRTAYKNIGQCFFYYQDHLDPKERARKIPKTGYETLWKTAHRYIESGVFHKASGKEPSGVFFEDFVADPKDVPKLTRFFVHYKGN
jgi:hypothetical protein